MRTGTLTMCGCYYLPSIKASKTKKYLPQVDLKAHTTILSTASRTVLSQTFVNPSSTTDVKECKYVFPLYDGVSVVGFTCQVGSRIINGLVKEKAKAQEEYDAAVERGETAGLLEQGPTSDVFMTSLGNIPAGEKLLVTVTYVGELKHDVGANGIRFTIPTSISPRYGQAGMDQNDSTVSKGGIAITVDVNMPEDSAIQEIRSPSHPIAVAFGRTSTSESQPPHLSRASATLSLGTSTLDKDIVLEIMHQDSGKPKALLETHPNISGQRALMATLVPNNLVQQSKPEIIFVADQSGSMKGARTKTLVAALRIFFKSLPVGIKFNICYFGTHHSLLFPVSQVYDQMSLEKTLKSLDGLGGKFGGTQTLNAIRASVESRDDSQPLSIILATDGDIWQQQELFDYLNNSVATSKKTLRVFALGIGNSVSSALINGVARAGNGFAQSVGEGEKLDGKVIRMLRGALIPDYGAFTMEIQYQKDEDEDGFVMVELVSDSLRVLELDENDWPDAQLDEEPAFSAETTAGGEKDVEMPDADGQARYNHLPVVPAPKLMQTPQVIPPLYPFSRTNVYILISPGAAQGTVKSVVLKGSSAENPFALEIPIEVLSEPGETIHQLAAKKTVSELEEGRGWLVHAKDENGVFIKEKYSVRFQSIVEREAVRLGIQYQIAGKFTSFVATETDPGNPENTVSRKAGIVEEAGTSPSVLYGQSAQPRNMPSFGALSSVSNFGALASRGPPEDSRSHTQGSSGLFASFQRTPAPDESIGSVQHKKRAFHSRMSTGGKAPRKQLASKAALKIPPDQLVPFSAEVAQDASIHDEGDAKPEDIDPLQKIIALQTFEGYWNLDAPLRKVVGLLAQHKAPQGVDSKAWATVLAVTFLERKTPGDKEAWEMVVDKARGWLKDMEARERGKFEEMWTLAEQLVVGAD